MRVLVIFASLLAAGCACGANHAPPPEPDYVCRDAGAGQMPTCGCRADAEDECPCNCSGLPGVCEPDCELCPQRVCQWFRPEPLPTPWWHIEPALRCYDAPAHDHPEALDDCELGPDNTATLPTECCVPASGAAICWDHVWTQTCTADADCPAGMGCGPEVSFTGGRLRFCQQRCVPTGSGPECVRCDQTCGDDGLCVPLLPDGGQPCEADCECFSGFDPYGAGNTHCIAGFCRGTGQTRRWGVCSNTSPIGDDDICACLGGTCEPNPAGGCCRGPDGHIATSSMDPICGGANAGIDAGP